MTYKISTKGLYSLLAALALSTVLWSCSQTGEASVTSHIASDSAAQMIPLSPQPPVKVAIVADQSGSRNWTRTPSVRPDDLMVLIELLQGRGGEIGLGLIRDDSNRSLVRLWIEPPPAAPKQPDQNTNPFVLLEERSRYEQQMERYTRSFEMWRQDSGARTKTFLAAVEPLLDPAVQSPRSDVWGALRRADMFLAEDRTAWGGSASCWVVLITDGEDNVSEPVTFLASNARLLVVNGSGSAGKLARLQLLLFESLDAALRHLVAEEQSR